MRPFCIAFLMLVVSAGSTTRAEAQSTRRPDLNVFGRALRDPQQSLGVTGNLGATFYDSLNDPIFGPDGTRLQDHGWGAFGSASLAYNLRLGAVRFDGSVGGGGTYYPSLPQRFRGNIFPGAGAQTGWSHTLSDKTSVTVNGSLRVRSLASESILAGGFSGSGSGSFNEAGSGVSAFLPQEAAFVDGMYLTMGSDVALTHELSRRFSLSGNYQIRRDTTFGADAETLGLWGQGAGAALHFLVTRNLSVRGGYVFSESHHTDNDRPLRSHSADIGVDYNQGALLQLTRRTTLQLTGGASAYADRSGRQHYRLTGTASLQHQIGRTWSSGVTYFRGLETSHVLFSEPVLTDTVTAQINGLVARRLGFHGTATAQRGAVGFGESGNVGVRSSLNSGLQQALTRHLALSLDYTYYRYDYGQLRRPLGLPSQSASQGVQAYLSVWAPVFERGGRSNAAR